MLYVKAYLGNKLCPYVILTNLFCAMFAQLSAYGDLLRDEKSCCLTESKATGTGPTKDARGANSQNAPKLKDHAFGRIAVVLESDLSASLPQLA